MEKRILGRTNFQVSSIGFGGIPIQSLDQDMAIKLIEEAYNRGINFIDTARGYMESEALIGVALNKIGRDKFYLATKSMKRDYKGIIEELNISLKNLRTDYIDLFQFHNVRTMEDYNNLMKAGGGYEAIKEAQNSGLVKEIGITSHSLEVLEFAVETDFFTTIQFPYNPVERQGEELFKRAKERNIGVIIMKPLAGGAIRKGELSLKFILSNSNVTVVIPGMDSVEQVYENSLVGINRQNLTQEEELELEKEIESLDSEFCRRCGYCLPCPENIDIPSQFLMEGYYTRYNNLKEWSSTRYRDMEYKAVHCVECGICETKCPYNLPIRAMLKKVVNTFG